MDLSDKSILIYDFGNFTPVAERLARDFGTVYYFVPWQQAFPKANQAIIGENLPGVERILNFWDYVDEADCIFFPDTYCGDMVEYLKGKNYRVAGAGRAEMLELERWKTRLIQKKLGLPLQETERVVGINKLRNYLKDHDNRHVKLNRFRGDIDSFKHDDLESSDPQIDYLEYDLGRKADFVEFIVEEHKSGIEPGMDGIFSGGKFYESSQWGYENKDKAYIAKMCDYSKIPKPMKKISDGIAEVLGKLKSNTFFSTELILDEKDNRGYLIDLTVRCAGPTMHAVQEELWDNYSEVVWGLATGEKIEPQASKKYGGSIVLPCDWNEKNWVKVNFPVKESRWYKPCRGCVFNGEYWNVPGFPELLTVTAIGDSPEEVVKLIKRRVERVKAFDCEHSCAPLDELLETIKAGNKQGLEF
jgi:hypothetical protein